MEKLIRLMTNNRTYNEQTDLAEQMAEVMEFTAVAVASLMVLAATTIL